MLFLNFQNLLLESGKTPQIFIRKKCGLILIKSWKPEFQHDFPFRIMKTQQFQR